MEQEHGTLDCNNSYILLWGPLYLPDNEHFLKCTTFAQQNIWKEKHYFVYLQREIFLKKSVNRVWKEMSTIMEKTIIKIGVIALFAVLLHSACTKRTPENILKQQFNITLTGLIIKLKPLRNNGILTEMDMSILFFTSMK